MLEHISIPKRNISERHFVEALADRCLHHLEESVGIAPSHCGIAQYPLQYPAESELLGSHGVDAISECIVVHPLSPAATPNGSMAELPGVSNGVRQGGL